MSIFPKRTLRNSRVTIHWNFNTAHLKEHSICPLVRIGVQDPLGKVTWLLEKHMLALPAISKEESSKEGKFLYLNKNTPLLIMADYLSGKQKKEKLVEILQNIQSGRHYYFSYEVPEDAPLGRYSLISTVMSSGEIRYSKTAADDFFLVEKVRIVPSAAQLEVGYSVILCNESPEAIPVKIIDYEPGKAVLPEQIQVFELQTMEKKEVWFYQPQAYLSYNEERELIPLLTPDSSKCIRNPYFLELHKEAKLYLLHAQTDESYELNEEQFRIWAMATGIYSRAQVRTREVEAEYDEMLEAGLLYEII